MLQRVLQAFRPLDTSAAEAAFAEAAKAQKAVAVRARALRMDVSCGEPGDTVACIVRRVSEHASHLLRPIYGTAAEPLPPALRKLIDDL